MNNSAAPYPYATFSYRSRLLPETSHFFLTKWNGSRSYIEAVTPSMVPNSLPIPRDKSIIKKMMDQKGAEGPNSTIAWVNIMNASPVPEAACNYQNYSGVRFRKKYKPQRKLHNFGHVRPEKIQISLRIRAGWSESSLGTFWIVKEAKICNVENEDSGQTAWMRRLIWVYGLTHMSAGTFSHVRAHMYLPECERTDGNQPEHLVRSIGPDTDSTLAGNVKRILWFSGLLLFTCACADPYLGYRHALFAWSCLRVSTTCLHTAKALARLRYCAGLPEPLLVAYVTSVLFSCAGSIELFALTHNWTKRF